MGATNAKCPYCGGRSFDLHERLETAHVFRVECGEVQPMFQLEGFPTQIGFLALCACGHRWVPRRATVKSVMDAEGSPTHDQ